jgi:O-antigen/teichoic acid export membrane protein
VSLVTRLTKSSSVYTIASILQNGLSFLLLPLYTKYLTPADYGVIAITTSVNDFLSVFLLLGLNSAITRFYYDYRDRPEELKIFWGTILTVIFLTTVSVVTLLIITEGILLKPLTGEIEFYPFIFVSLLTLIFQPFFNIYISITQTREQPQTYVRLTLLQFLLNVGLSILLIVNLKMGVMGALSARSIVMAIMAILSMSLLSREISIGIKFPYLKEALAYALPIIPHSLASQVSAISSKIIINQILNTNAVGLYNIGLMLGSIMSIITTGVNRAFVPIYMDTLSAPDDSKLTSLKELGSLIVVVYCLIGSFVALFSPEILMLLTAKPFWESYRVASIVVGSFLVNGVYYLLVNSISYNKQTVHLLAVGSAVGGVSNILLGIYLINNYGYVGAAAADVISNIIVAICMGFIGYKDDRVSWDYFGFIKSIVTSFTIYQCILAATIYYDIHEIYTIAVKIAGWIIIFVLLNIFNWKQPFYLTDKLYPIVKKYLPSSKK